MAKKKRKLVASIRDFASDVGRGYTDDTEAFKAAKASKMDQIQMPPGIYNVNKGEVDLDHRFIFVPRKRKPY